MSHAIEAAELLEDPEIIEVLTEFAFNAEPPQDNALISKVLEKMDAVYEQRVQIVCNGFNHALNFALEGKDEDGFRLTDSEARDFLRMWREGNFSEINEVYPTFKDFK